MYDQVHFNLPMASSPGFGSTSCHLAPCSDSLSLRLHLIGLTLPHNVTRRLILQEACGHTRSVPRRAIDRGAPTVCKQVVSSSISLPSRGAFHLSLTVLVHYRSSAVFSLGGWSPQIPTGFLVSRGTQVHKQRPHPFVYRTITFYSGPFQKPSTRMRFCNSVMDSVFHLLCLTTPTIA